MGDVPSDSVTAGSFDWWSRCVNDIFQNRYQKQDSFKMRKIGPKERDPLIRRLSRCKRTTNEIATRG
jgi:hypothetical protein